MLKRKNSEIAEQRYFPRLRISFEVDIYRDRYLLGRFKTRNISFDGMYLETNGIAFDNNDIIGVHLALSDTTPIQRGIVTHVSRNGIGVVLIDFSKEVYLDIYMLYKERRIPLKRSLVGIESQGMKWQRLLMKRETENCC